MVVSSEIWENLIEFIVCSLRSHESDVCDIIIHISCYKVIKLCFFVEYLSKLSLIYFFVDHISWRRIRIQETPWRQVDANGLCQLHC